MRFRYWTVLRNGLVKLLNNRVISKCSNNRYLLLKGVNYFRIVQAFENIVDVLINQVNFTNLSVVQTDLAFRGERVST